MKIEQLGKGTHVQFLTLQELYKYLRLDAQDEDDIENDENADLVNGLYHAAISEVESILGKSLSPQLFAQYDSGETITLEEFNVIKDTIKVFEGETELSANEYNVVVNREITFIEFESSKDVKIEYESGYTQDNIPAEYLMAIRMLVKEYFDNEGKERRAGNISAVERILRRTRRF